MKSADIRNSFLKYFEGANHKIVQSSSLLPVQDPTLLFTNAGMNQFKGVFTGQEKRNYSRAVSSQKCVRAGGKHNDLENVGRTARHHTFFEMLGNFSFGDYFKQEAIEFAWRYVTEVVKLPSDKLYVSVYKDDDEAFDLWNKKIGIEASRIYRFGEKDNFWSMGPVGPCGPCSEIFFDQGPELEGEKVGDDGDRFLEFWNLVFMEFEQKADGSRIKLPKPSIDTGMGLERISGIVQKVKSNYDTDLFTPLLSAISKKAGLSYASAESEQKISMRVIADHLRCMTFLIGDGIEPSKEGRGYVLRRIMRRAMRHGKNLGFEKPFLFELSQSVVEVMGGHYAELQKQHKLIAQSIFTEEERFLSTIDRGLGLLEAEIKNLKPGESLKGEVAFHLYDTYGFPVDMTADILREKKLNLDQNGFDEAFEAHREKARGSWKGGQTSGLNQLVQEKAKAGLETIFLGYDQLQVEAKVLMLSKEGKEIESAKEGDHVEVVFNQTPFYGEGGGQVGDVGALSGKTCSAVILDTQKPSPNVFVHFCVISEGELKKSDAVVLSVDEKARSFTARNHTATHMLHATLLEVLGSHIKQKGSYVSPERLRFDITHPKALTTQELLKIEEKVNERIWQNDSLQKEVMPLDQAMQSGATALFDEKYGDQVRVVSIGSYSKELCGGTHLKSTGEIGVFKIIKESSVSAGVRRIEAITSSKALRLVQDNAERLKSLGTMLGSAPEKIEERIAFLLEQQKQNKKNQNHAPQSVSFDSQTINAVKFNCAALDQVDHKKLRDIADQEMNLIKSGVVAVAGKMDGKVSLIVKVSKEFEKSFPAGSLVQKAAKVLEGSGGGKPDMAQAGGVRVDKIQEAFEEIKKTFI